MAHPVQVGGIPLDEYSKTVPPGWRENIDGYPFKTYIEKLRLWHRITEYQDHEKGPIIVGRLKGGAYKYAVRTSISRVREVQNPDTGHLEMKVVQLKGDDALCEPASARVLDNAGRELLPAQVSGVRALNAWRTHSRVCVTRSRRS